MAENVKKKKTLWNFVDSLEGDKVVWMIVILLILFSIVAIFSSTSLLAIQQKTTRMAIVSEQMILSAIGLAIIILCCAIPKIGFFRIASQFGYAVSMALLLMLALASFTCKGSSMNLGLIKVLKINEAWRAISVFGFQIHVFEIVKVAMIMYLAWAVNAFRNDNFSIANLLAKDHPFWRKPLVKKAFYIYLPILSVCFCIMVGSLSSTLFIGAMMLATILIGGISVRELILPVCIIAGLMFGCIGINACFDDGNKPFPHLESALERVTGDGIEGNLRVIQKSPRNSIEFQKAVDKIRQPISAKIAIHEGGLIGKGPGRSTQRYVVPVMFEDYMFSFIVEEYGLLGGIFVIILYISLLARGSIIVRNCDNHFAKTAVAGLVLLITGQAMMHIAINCDMGPLTGQTLPMISHGNSSFLMFSLAFGIILSISKMAKRKIAREAADAAPLVNREIRDEVSSRMDDLDQMESGLSMQDNGLGEEGLTVHENDIPDYGMNDHNNE
jgi:cell division protein FtsW